MRRRPPRSTRTDTLFPYTTLFRSYLCLIDLVDQGFQRTVQLQQRRIRDGLLATGRRSDTGNHHGACQQYESNGGHQEHLRYADEGRDMVVERLLLDVHIEQAAPIEVVVRLPEGPGGNDAIDTKLLAFSHGLGSQAGETAHNHAGDSQRAKEQGGLSDPTPE